MSQMFAHMSHLNTLIIFLSCLSLLLLPPKLSLLLFLLFPFPPVHYSPLVCPLALLSLSLLPLCLPVDINAQARKLQRNRAKGTLTLPRSSNSSLCRSLSETSLNQVEFPVRMIDCYFFIDLLP